MNYDKIRKNIREAKEALNGKTADIDWFEELSSEPPEGYKDLERKLAIQTALIFGVQEAIPGINQRGTSKNPGARGWVSSLGGWWPRPGLWDGDKESAHRDIIRKWSWNSLKQNGIRSLRDLPPQTPVRIYFDTEYGKDGRFYTGCGIVTANGRKHSIKRNVHIDSYHKLLPLFEKALKAIEKDAQKKRDALRGEMDALLDTHYAGRSASTKVAQGALTKDEKKVLVILYGFKSSYRKQFFSENGLGDYSPSNASVKGLLGKGLAKVRGGKSIVITRDGKDVAKKLTGGRGPDITLDLIERGKKASTKVARSAGKDIFMRLVDLRELGKVRSALSKAGDKQSAQLLREVMEKTITELEPRNKNVIKVVNSLSTIRPNLSPEMLRNKVFKLADMLGMRLPSGIFASDKTAKSDTLLQLVWNAWDHLEGVERVKERESFLSEIAMLLSSVEVSDEAMDDPKLYKLARKLSRDLKSLERQTRSWRSAYNLAKEGRDIDRARMHKDLADTMKRIKSLIKGLNSLPQGPKYSGFDSQNLRSAMDTAYDTFKAFQKAISY